MVKLIEENASLREELEQYKTNIQSGGNKKVSGVVQENSSNVNFSSNNTPVRPKESFSTPKTTGSSFLSTPPPTSSSMNRSGPYTPTANNMGGMNSPGQANNMNNNNAVMVNTLQNIIATLTAEMQDKEIAIEQQRQAKEQLGATIIQQLSIINTLEEKLKQYEASHQSSNSSTDIQE